MSYSPDGIRLAASTNRGTAEVWDVASLKLILTILTPSAVSNGIIDTVAWNPNGEEIAVGGAAGPTQSDPMVVVYDAHTGKSIHVFSAADEQVTDKVYAPIQKIQWFPDGRHLAIIPIPTADPNNTQTGQAFYPLDWDSEQGGTLLFDKNDWCDLGKGFYLSPDTQYNIMPMPYCGEGDIDYVIANVFLSGFSGNAIEPIADLGIGRQGVQDIAWRPDSQQFAVLHGTNGLTVYDLQQSDAAQPNFNQTVTSTLFGNFDDVADQGHMGIPDWEVVDPYQYQMPTTSPNGKLIAAYDETHSTDGVHTVLFDSNTGAPVKTLDTASIPQSTDCFCRPHCIREMNWSPDGTRLEAAWDTGINVWDVGSGHVLFTKNNPMECFWSSASMILVCRDEYLDQNGWQWSPILYTVDATNGKRIQTLSEHVSDFRTVWSSQQRIASIITDDNHILMWDGSFQHLLLDVPGANVTWNTDSTRFIVSKARGQFVALFDGITLKPIVLLDAEDNSVAVFSPDGKFFAASFATGEIDIWESSTGHKRLRLFGHRASSTLVWKSDNTQLLSKGSDGTQRVWVIG